MYVSCMDRFLIEPALLLHPCTAIPGSNDSFADPYQIDLATTAELLRGEPQVSRELGAIGEGFTGSQRGI
jgi:hypothetical protein